jgi:hypothetical protein
MNNLNNVLIVGCSESTEYLAKQMYEISTFEDVKIEDVPFRKFQYQLTTKYYEATVDFYMLDISKKDKPEQFFKNFQSVLSIYKCVDSFNKLKDYLSKLTDLTFETCLCIQQQEYEDVGKHKQLVQQWCMNSGYEFVELIKDQKKEKSGLLKGGSTGINRIMEALECTMWPKMKRIVPNKNKQEKKEENKTVEENKDVEKKTDEQKKTLETLDDEYFKKLVQEELDEDEKKTDSELEKFDNLIAQALQLRSQGHNLGHEERKERAAQIAMQLLQMLDGEDEEK